MVHLLVKKLNEDSKLPYYAEFDSAGLDIHAAEDCVLEPGKVRGIRTGIAVEFFYNAHCADLSKKLYILIASRSGMAAKHGIFVLTGTIDQSYRGELFVVLGNFGQEPYSINKGDRIAQGIIYEVPKVDVAEATELSSSIRGANGFGSTGKR